MKFALTAALLLSYLIALSQPANKRYWVGPETGGSLTGVNGNHWATVSGGVGGSQPLTSNYQLIFDGGGTPGKIYSINLNSGTSTASLGGYIVVTNNTTVILQATGMYGPYTMQNSGYNVDAGSKLVLDNKDWFNNGVFGNVTYFVDNNVSYGGTIAGELVVRSPQVNCGSQACPGTWLNLSGLITPSGTKVLNVTGTLRLEGKRSMIHVSHVNTLSFAAGSNFIVNTDDAEPYFFTFNPAATVTLSGSAGMAGYVYPNVVYESPSQTNSRTFSNTINGNLSVKNTGTGLLTLTGTVKGNLQVEGSANVQSPGMTVNGNVILDGGGFDVNGTVNVQGNFTNNSGIVKATTPGRIRFNGASQQTVRTGAVNNEALSFEVNNPNGLLINSDWLLPAHTGSNLYLTNGNIVTGGNVLTVQNPSPGAIVGGTAASHIIGRLRRSTNSAGDSYLFPVDNTATESANVKISPIGSSVTTYEVSFARPNPYNRLAVPAGVRNAANYYWDIKRISGTENANLTFVYGDNNFQLENANQFSELRVLHWNGTTWDNLGGSGINGEISVDNVSAFSPFSFGTVGPYLLPVNLLSFVGRRHGNSNELSWTVAQEKDGQAYELERSADRRSFLALSRINATFAGQYAYTDHHPLPGINFYRLKLIDRDGKITYSQVLSLKINSKLQLEVYPNPASATLHVQLNVEDGRLFIHDAAGRLVKAFSLTQTGTVSTSLDISDLKPGTYFIKTGSQVARFVKQE